MSRHPLRASDALRALRLFAPLAALALSSACAIEEDDFPTAYGDAMCDQFRRCERSNYEDSYSDHADCVEGWAEFAETLIDGAEFFGGEYSPEAGRECVDGIRAAECSEFDDGDYDGSCDDLFSGE